MEILTKQKLEKVAAALSDNVLYNAERATTAAEVQALAAAVHAFSEFIAVLQEVPDVL